MILEWRPMIPKRFPAIPKANWRVVEVTLAPAHGGATNSPKAVTERSRKNRLLSVSRLPRWSGTWNQLL